MHIDIHMHIQKTSQHSLISELSLILWLPESATYTPLVVQASPRGLLKDAAASTKSEDPNEPEPAKLAVAPNHRIATCIVTEYKQTTYYKCSVTGGGSGGGSGGGGSGGSSVEGEGGVGRELPALETDRILKLLLSATYTVMVVSTQMPFGLAKTAPAPVPSVYP